MTQTSIEKLAQYQQRVEQLNARRTRVQVQLEAARQQYAEAVAEAKSNYGTENLEELKTLLAKQEAENTKALAEFVRAVDEFERFIVRIEEALANPAALAAMVADMPTAETPAASDASDAAAAEAFSGDDI